MNQMFSHQNEKPKARYNINKVNARNIAGSSVLKKFYSTVSMHLQESRDTEMRNPILYDREAENASEELEDRHFWVERINAQKQTPHFLPHGKQEHLVLSSVFCFCRVLENDGVPPRPGDFPGPLYLSSRTRWKIPV